MIATLSDILCPNGRAVHLGPVRGKGTPIAGAVLELTDAQLAAADTCEGSIYARITANLKS